MISTMANTPDLTPPIIYVDEETGRVVRGGEDSPRADALRKELDERMKFIRARNRSRMWKKSGVIPRQIGPEPEDFVYPWNETEKEE